MRRLITKVYISFAGYQSQTTERVNALYDMYECILIIFGEKGLETIQKVVRMFVDSFKVFIVSFY